MDRTFTTEDIRNAEPLDKFRRVFKMDSQTVVKASVFTRQGEADVMDFVRANTTIPIPRVHNTWVEDGTGRTVIAMDYIEGEQLDKVWASLDAGERESVLVQLRGYMWQLRQLRGTFIGGFDGTGCDEQFYEEYEPFLMTAHEIVLTHGDLHPRNILVRGSEVVAILDWEFAGYYPKYWEYRKASMGRAQDGSWTEDLPLDEVLEKYVHKNRAVALSEGITLCQVHQTP